MRSAALARGVAPFPHSTGASLSIGDVGPRMISTFRCPEMMMMMMSWELGVRIGILENGL